MSRRHEGRRIWAVAAGTALAVAISAAPGRAETVCTSNCDRDVNWCQTVYLPVVQRLRSELIASLDYAQSILDGIPVDSPYRYMAQYNVDLHTNARDAIDLAVAEWDLTVVSFVEAGGLMGTANVVVRALDEASWYATITAIYFRDPRAWQSLERLRVLIAKFSEFGTRCARCYMRAYVPPPCT